jgi:hypothetical protein
VYRLTLLGVAGALLATSTLRADDEAEARQIIQKAIAAQGGAEKLGQIKALTTKVRGRIFVADEWRKFSGESAIQQPRQFKNVIRLNMNFNEAVVIEILDGDKGWSYNRELDGTGEFRTADKEEMAEMKRRAYVDYVSSLLPLIEDKKYHLSIVAAGKDGADQLVGIKIVSPGQAEVRLVFSKKTGLLARREFLLKEAHAETENRLEYRLEDYRDVNPTAQDEEVLKSAKLSAEPGALLDYLSKQSLADADRAKVEELIKKLGDSSFEVREKAKKELLEKGSAAVPDLRRAVSDPDPEIAGSARECLRSLEKSLDNRVLSAVLRLTADSRPKGAAAALLGYLPSAPTDAIRQEVEAALAIVGFQDGKADPALVEALKDNDATRRAVAEKLVHSADKAKPGSRGQLLLRGVLFPTKESLYQGGKKVMEWELTDIKFYDRLNPQQYFRPRS